MLVDASYCIVNAIGSDLDPPLRALSPKVVSEIGNAHQFVKDFNPILKPNPTNLSTFVKSNPNKVMESDES